MADLIVTKNPFSLKTSTTRIQLISGDRNVKKLVERYWTLRDIEVIVLLNKVQVPEEDFEDTEVQDGDVLFFCPAIYGSDDNKRIGLMAAQIIVTAVATWYLGPGGATGAKAFFAVVGAVGANALISYQMQRYAQDPFSAAEGELELGNTYGWQTGTNRTQIGQTLPVVYGTMKVRPALISSYISYTKDNEPRLNALYAVCEGEVENIIIAANSDPSIVQINGQNWVEYNIGYGTIDSTIQLEYRDGNRNTLTPMSGFDDIVQEQTVNRELVMQVAQEWTTISDQVSRFGVGIYFPRGLFVFDAETGEIKEHSLDLEWKYKMVGGSWSSPIAVTFKDSSQKGVRRFIDMTEVLGTEFIGAQFTVSVRVTSDRQVDSKYTEEVYFEFMQERISANLLYPGVTLLAFKGLASDRISGAEPVLDVTVTRKPFSFTGYEADSPSNPAWVAYDILSNYSSGAGLGTGSQAPLILSEFQAWADWCDNPASTTVSHKLEFNGIFDTTQSVADALRYVGAVGRGAVALKGTSYGVIFDGIEEPSQVFTVGNIIADSFSMAFTGSDDLANSIEISFLDKDAGYARKSFEVQSEGFDAGDVVKKVTINAIGVTNFDQAKRMAKYALNLNQYISRTCSFDAASDAIAVIPGDVIEVQHDVPLWGYGGRVVSSTSNTITIDREVPTVIGTTYRIVVRSGIDDSSETVDLAAPGTGYFDVFTLASGTWTREPVAGEIYSLGEVEKHTKLFRVNGIKKSSELTCTIDASEYREEVYDDGVDIPDYINQSDLITTGNLVGDDVFILGTDGEVRQANIDVNWRGYAVAWQVFYRDIDVGTWIAQGSTNYSRATIEDVKVGHTYEIAVSTTNNPQNAEYVQVEVVVDPPGAVIDLTAASIDNFVTLRWQKPKSNLDLPISHYELKKGSDFSTAPVVGRADKTFTTFFELASGDYTYWVYAVDTAGNKGTETSVSLSLTLPSDYQQPTEFYDDLAGVGANLVVEESISLVGPLAASETWQEHFENNGWGDVQDAIDAGYTYYFEPGPYPQSASYVGNVIDFLALFSKATISVEVDYDVLVGNPAKVFIKPNLMTSPDNVTYTDHNNLWQFEAQNFRYAKVGLNISTLETDIVVKITQVKVTLYAKKYRESGIDNVSVPATGKEVAFVYGFADVSSIQVTPQGTGSASRTAIYDFTDVPNPTSFTVYLFDENGDPTTGNFSYSIEGI